MVKRGSLAAFTSQKETSAEDQTTSQAPAGSDQQSEKPKRRGQTLRLTPAAWRQLKLMTIEQERTAHDLLPEAVSDLFQKDGKRALS